MKVRNLEEKKKKGKKEEIVRKKERRKRKEKTKKVRKKENQYLKLAANFLKNSIIIHSIFILYLYKPQLYT